MRLLTTLAVICGLLAPVTATAGQPVVVELFTSQGCSSCPPADAFASDLIARRDDVIVLAWHVDYWDYLGWKDRFSRPENTARQEGYRDRWNLRSLYTPQMVIQGETQVVGSNAREVRMYIDTFGAEMPMLDFGVVRQGNTAAVRITPLTANLPEAEVFVVALLPESETRIERGENAGRTLRYVNVVQRMTRLAIWDGKTPLQVDGVELTGGRFVLLVQARDFGPILGARYLN